jgi:hypothetical protein
VIRLSSYLDQYCPRERTHLDSKASNLEVVTAVVSEAVIAVVSAEVTEADSEEDLAAGSVVETEVDSEAAIEAASVVEHQEAVSECKRIN